MIFQVLLVQGCCILATAIEYDRENAITNDNCTRYLSRLPSRNETVGFGSRLMCPPWYYASEGSCRKGAELHGIVEFETKTEQTWLQSFYCMTTNVSESERTDVIGACLPTFYLYPLPCNVSRLNEYMCAGLNREDQLCGRCVKGFAPPIYSYSLSCANCTNYHLNWLKYIGVAFGPLTLFCLFICFFHISATSPYLHGFVFFCQIVTSPTVMRILVNGNALNPSFNTNSAIAGGKAYSSLLSVWNLDFFATVYEPFCLHPNVSVVEALALNYLVGLYPLVLIPVVLLLVKLHSRNIKLIVTPWKPFRTCLRPFLRNLNIQTSLIESFATLFFLSAMKIQSVSIDLLAPTALYYVDGTKSNKLYLYFAADVEYFGSHHFPYGLLALFFLATFMVLPALLLFLYPWRFFQRFLNKINCNSLTLKTFMDVFQGNYKDGTCNTRDYRFFSGIFFCTRFLITASFLLLNSPFFQMFTGTVVTMLGFSVAITRPQHRYIHYLLDTLILMILSLIIFSVIGKNLQHKTSIPDKVQKYFVAFAVVLPIFYIVFLVGYWVFIKIKIPQKIASFIARKVSGRSHSSSYEKHSLLSKHASCTQGE